MDLSTWAVLVFGGALAGMWRAQELRAMQVLCAGLVGFFLASSDLFLAAIRAVLTLCQWVSSWHT